MKLCPVLSFLVFAVSLASCAKEIPDLQEKSDTVRYKTVSFEVVATKTTLGADGTVEWEKGDRISIYYENAEGVPATAVATAESAGMSAVFHAEIPEADKPGYYFATYPHGRGTLTLTDGVPSFTINVTASSCDGSFKNANFAVAYTESDVLHFRNAVGIIKVTLPDSGALFKDGVKYPITGLYLRCKATSVNINGRIVFTPGADENKMFSASTKENGMGGAANIFMSSLSSDAVNSGAIYMPCTPAVWPDGICLRYYSSTGKIPAVLTRNKEVSVKRGHILPIADFSSKVVWDYYVSPDAGDGGSGLSADDPMTLADYQDDFIGGADDLISDAMRMDGTTLHLMNGIYKLNSTLKFPAGKSPYEVTVDGNGAVLDGTGRVVSVGYNSHVVLNGITLQNGSADTGGGIAVAYTAKSTDENSVLECNDCKFIRNVASSGGGGAISVSDDAAGGLLKFDGCLFLENQTSFHKGGAVLYSDKGKAAALFNKCTLHGNVGHAYGADIHMNNSSARLGMNNCTVTPHDAPLLNEGASIINKGYTVISNSTIWASEAIGELGCVALGSAVTGGVQGGSVVVSSVIRNGNSLPAFFLHEDYYQNIRHCIFTGAVSSSGAVQGEGYTIDAESHDAGVNGISAETSVADALLEDSPYYAYLWDWQEAYPCPTLETVRKTIAGTPAIGPLFLSWLDRKGNTLCFDIAGRPRNENAICPGSYQQETTPDVNADYSAGIPLRVASFNIMREDIGGSDNNWTKRKTAVLQMLSVNTPDLMGLQECSWTIRKDIVDADARRKAIGVSVSGKGCGYTSESSNSIIYRSDVLEVLKSGTFWLSDTPDVVSDTWNADKPRTCTWAKFREKRTGQEFYLYNAHLHNGSTAQIKETREKSVVLIMERIAEENRQNLPVVVTGDHNTTEAVLNGLYSAAGLSSARAMAPVTDTGRTLNSFSETVRSVIDHIYVTAGCAPSHLWVDRSPYAGIIYVSDHYPVFCDMRIRTRNFSATMDGFSFGECEF